MSAVASQPGFFEPLLRYLDEPGTHLKSTRASDIILALGQQRMQERQDDAGIKAMETSERWGNGSVLEDFTAYELVEFMENYPDAHIDRILESITLFNLSL